MYTTVLDLRRIARDRTISLSLSVCTESTLSLIHVHFAYTLIHERICNRKSEEFPTEEYGMSVVVCLFFLLLPACQPAIALAIASVSTTALPVLSIAQSNENLVLSIQLNFVHCIDNRRAAIFPIFRLHEISCTSTHKKWKLAPRFV